MNFTESTGLLLKAIRFSAEKHRNQRRKDVPKSPYINHPIEVAETLWEVGGVRDSVTLIAALLHDTIEDTNTTSVEIEQNFGYEVMSLVLEVTDDKTLPRPQRKAQQIVTAPLKSPRAKLIKLADKICNIRDLIFSPPADWSWQRQYEYLLWSEKVVRGLRGTNPALESYYDDMFRRGKDHLDSRPA